ncbi:MAG TPA: MFS transporter [Aquabacterium sp.]|uniref:MFS transporter n=1 Tax=Aquabacterium sp. TaxID=1872578 RepID=UPI002E3226B8|nr:MFS transporter [Aquabacterium sp.]HEX5372393.1 MFS transporter [Aquabacterium sp.]
MSEGHQFRLLRQRRYAPFFWTVFLGTLNDNLLKFAVTLLLTYQVSLAWLPPAVVGPATGALFILPSLLLSATAGQWADKWPLDRLIRAGKALEVAMMLLAAWAVWQREPWTLLGCLLLSGIHVTVFSTLKYAYVPRHLDEPELVGGNGLLEMGMFTAILLGSLVGGLLVAPREWWPGLPMGVEETALPLALVVLALLGWWRAQAIPMTAAVDPELHVHLNPIGETWRNLQRASAHGQVLWSLLGISWMWFFGAVFLSLFPALTHDTLKAPSSVASLLLVLISLGIGSGALMCERLARGHSPLRLVPLGALGMAVFGGDLAWSVMQLEQGQGLPTGGWHLQAILGEVALWRLLADVWLMAMSVGWFSVPLYAHMQAQSEPSHRARIVGANNILNAVFILLSAALAWGLGAAGLSYGQVFAATIALHLLACGLAWRILRAQNR